MATQRSTWLVLALALLTGCSSTSPVTVSAVPSASPSVAIATTTLTGVIQAPTGVIPVGAGNLSAAGSGNVIPTGGGLWQVLELKEAPLAGATVQLADASGTAYAAIAAVTTDDQGRFTFKDVPSELTMMVVASAHDSTTDKDVSLRTLVKPGALQGASATVDTASTIVTAGAVDGSSVLGAFDPATFQAAVTATAAHLRPEDQPDLSSQPALLARAQALAQDDAALRTGLDRLHQDLQAINDQLRQIADAMRRPPASPPPGGQLPPGGTPGSMPPGSQGSLPPQGSAPPQGSPPPGSTPPSGPPPSGPPPSGAPSAPPSGSPSGPPPSQQPSPPPSGAPSQPPPTTAPAGNNPPPGGGGGNPPPPGH